MHDSIDLLVGARVEWVGDKVILAALKPRHIGSVVTFDNFLSNYSDDYTSISIMGILEAVIGTDLIVSGDAYEYDHIKDLKVYRRIVK